MVKYVKYIHYLTWLWSLDAVKLKRRVFCCLTHNGVKDFMDDYVLVLLLLCSSHYYISVLFDLKSAFVACVLSHV